MGDFASSFCALARRSRRDSSKLPSSRKTTRQKPVDSIAVFVQRAYRIIQFVQSRVLRSVMTAFPAQIMLAARLLLASSAFCKAPRRISPLKVKIFCVTHAYRGSTDGLIVAQRHVVHGGIFRTAPYGHDFAPFLSARTDQKAISRPSFSVGYTFL